MMYLPRTYAMLAAGFAGLLWAGAVSAYTLTLSSADLQQVIAPAFPIYSYTAHAKLEFSAPVVVTDTTQQRVGLELTLHIRRTAGGESTGRVLAVFTVGYESATGLVFLTKPHAMDLRFGDAPPKDLADLQRAVQEALLSELAVLPLAHVNERQLNHTLPTTALHGTRVTPDAVAIDIGFR